MDIYCVVAILTGIIAGFMIGASYAIIDVLLSKKQLAAWIRVAIGFAITFSAIRMVPNYTWVTLVALCVTFLIMAIVVHLVAHALMGKQLRFSAPLKFENGENTGTATTDIAFTLRSLLK